MDTGHKSVVFKTALIRPIAMFCGGFAVLTIFWPDWIEGLTGYDPDPHDGTGRVAYRDSALVDRTLLALAARARWCRPRGSRSLRIDTSWEGRTPTQSARQPHNKSSRQTGCNLGGKAWRNWSMSPRQSCWR